MGRDLFRTSLIAGVALVSSLALSAQAQAQAFADAYWDYAISGNRGDFNLAGGAVHFTCQKGRGQLTVTVAAGGTPRQTTIEFRNGGNFYRSTANKNAGGTYTFTIPGNRTRSMYRILTQFDDVNIDVAAAGPIYIQTGSRSGSDVASVMQSFCQAGNFGGSSSGGSSGGSSSGGSSGGSSGSGSGSGSVTIDLNDLLGGIFGGAGITITPGGGTGSGSGSGSGGSSGGGAGIVELPCSAEFDARSSNAGGNISMVVQNNSGRTRTIYWIDFSGDRQRYARIGPGESYLQATAPGHPWLAADSNGRCRAMVVPLSDSTFVIND